MAVLKLPKRKEPKILFGIILSKLEANLYKAIHNKKEANIILKESLNINPRRLITLVDVVNSEGKEFDLLVIYDTLINENEEIKFLGKLEVKQFNFHIFNFRKDEIDIESIIGDNYEKNL